MVAQCSHISYFSSLSKHYINAVHRHSTRRSLGVIATSDFMFKDIFLTLSCYCSKCNIHHSTPKYTTVHHSTPQYTTVHHSTPQYTTVHNSTPQYTGTPGYSNLMRVAFTICHFNIKHSVQGPRKCFGKAGRMQNMTTVAANLNLICYTTTIVLSRVNVHTEALLYNPKSGKFTTSWKTVINMAS